MSEPTGKYSITMPRDIAEAARIRRGPSGLSGYVAAAVARQIERDNLNELIAVAEAEHGPVTEEEVRARREELRQARTEQGHPRSRPAWARASATPAGTLVLDSEGLAKAVLRAREVTQWLALALADDLRVITSAAAVVEVAHPRLNRQALEWTLCPASSWNQLPNRSLAAQRPFSPKLACTVTGMRSMRCSARQPWPRLAR